MMNRKDYLLDTHILVWLLRRNNRLNKNIREDIEYFQHSYYASVVSLHEIIFLIQNGKMESDDSISKIIKETERKQIQFLDIKPKHIEVLEKLSTPYIGKDPHKDQFDRTIISQGIAEGLTVISADTVFPLYKDKGFKLLENI
jgi:PIN domain nuclease of toxin-antitoxin system